MKLRNFLVGLIIIAVLVFVVVTFPLLTWIRDLLVAVMSPPITWIRDSLSPHNLKDQVQIIKDLVTALGIVLAGVWAFYNFGLGRSFAANLQIRFGLKQVIEADEGKAAVISTRVKNNGRTNVRKEEFEGYYRLGPEGTPSMDDLLSLQDWDVRGLDPVKPGEGVLTFAKFNTHKGFEPGEEVAEEVIIPLGEVTTFKVAGILRTRPKQPAAFLLQVWHQIAQIWRWIRRREKKLRWVKRIPYRAYFPSEVFDVRGVEQGGPSDLDGDANGSNAQPTEAITGPGAAEVEARETQVEETGAKADLPEPS